MRRVSDEVLSELRVAWGIDDRAYLSPGIVPDLLADRADDIARQAKDAARIAELEADLSQAESLRAGAVAHHHGLVERLRYIFDAFFGKEDTQPRAMATEFDVVQLLKKLRKENADLKRLVDVAQECGIAFHFEDGRIEHLDDGPGWTGWIPYYLKNGVTHQGHCHPTPLEALRALDAMRVK